MDGYPDIDWNQTTVLYNPLFPNERLVAQLCPGPSFPLEDYEKVKTPFVVVFSDYKTCKMHKQWIVFSGTKQFCQSKQGQSVMRGWHEFEIPGTAAHDAYSYWKCLPAGGEEAIVSTCRPEMFKSMVEKGGAYLDRERWAGEQAAAKAVVLFDCFQAVTLGMAPGIHVTHAAMKTKWPKDAGTIIHYIVGAEDDLVHRWSVCINDQAMLQAGDSIFQVLGCQEFGPPLKDIKIGQQRGGRDGISFNEATKECRFHL